MKRALDTYFELNYKKLLQAAVNILGEESSVDALHTIILKLYSMNEERTLAMTESGWLDYYVIRSLVNERREMSAAKSKTIGCSFENDGCEYGIGDEPTLREVLGNVKSAAYDALSSLVAEVKLNSKLARVLKYETTAFERIVYNKVVMDGLNFREMERNTGIPRSTLFEAYDSARKKLRAAEKNKSK